MGQAQSSFIAPSPPQKKKGISEKIGRLESQRFLVTWLLFFQSFDLKSGIHQIIAVPAKEKKFTRIAGANLWKKIVSIYTFQFEINSS